MSIPARLLNQVDFPQAMTAAQTTELTAASVGA
jgi:hypothetical protein